ncbi:hypothetical protein FA95DRAFT_1609803 [Auriscalpium vulgare]|uniref:Uncharacterized protein n=1 Tax=Auriscalpium vulgare TaxID=40419 RepID=A0ACB8RG90_9AGAM|nr:hypothetical protein FA95DRAFT_1609803 [Auriscalpium vulgare]
MSSDHAEDQKKLFKLLEAWKVRIERTTRGEELLLSMASPELIDTLFKSTEEKIRAAGGAAAWDVLSDAQKKERNSAAFDGVCLALGSAAISELSEQEKGEVDLFIWAGCGMHKEMNSVKGGNKRMAAWWIESGLVPPVKLMNCDNAAAAAGGSSSARARATEVSEGGGVKATSLAGAIFHHKDDKKGQQDSLQIFLEASIGFMVRFPDTSNTRYQSHCEAAAELLVHLDLYVDFLELALKDIPMLTELAVLVLYSQSISHPYMRTIRGSKTGDLNALDLGPFHESVKAHCQAIIAEPGLLLSSSASYVTGALDGVPWQRPEAFYAVHHLIPQLPHLSGALVAFFEGALETWERFTSEFDGAGRIAHLSASQRRQAFMLPTNDPNEGKLGTYRVRARQAPNKSLATFNAEEMYKQNHTGDWMKTQFNRPEDRKFLRLTARSADAAGLGRKMRDEQAASDRQVVEAKRAKVAAQKQKAAANDAALDSITVNLDLTYWKECLENDKKTTVARIDEQLAWHRREEAKCVKTSTIPKKSHLKNKKDKLSALISAIQDHKLHEEKTGGAEEISGSQVAEEDVEMCDGIAAESDSDADSDLYH